MKESISCRDRPGGSQICTSKTPAKRQNWLLPVSKRVAGDQNKELIHSEIVFIPAPEDTSPSPLLLLGVLSGSRRGPPLWFILLGFPLPTVEFEAVSLRSMKKKFRAEVVLLQLHLIKLEPVGDFTSFL